MMALMMSQLQPLLQGFNVTLQQVSRQVEDLSRDVAQLRSRQPGAGLQTGAFGRPEPDEGAEERFDAKLDEVFQQVEEVRRQLERQRVVMEEQLHSQHAMLHYNLTSFKTDVDLKQKRNQKMLQLSLHTMNATLVDLKLDQDQLAEDLQAVLSGRFSPAGTPPPAPPLPQTTPPPAWQPPDTSALRKTIERLENMVVNNTVKVGGLQQDVAVASGGVQQLRRSFKDLEERIVQTGRNSQIQFMETGLEVEAAKVAVLSRVEELAGNLSQQSERLQEMDVDVDYLYTALYKHSNTSGDCDCGTLQAAVTRLERGVANVTELANENRLTLDESSEGGVGQWGGASDWEPAVEALQHGLQQVKESLVFEQTRTRTLNHNLTLLSGSMAASLAEVSGLQEAERRLKEEMKHLSSSFTSLLKDAIRHSDVLELLLGEEVLEFLDWPISDQEAHSIPALKEQLRNMQEQLSFTSLLGRTTGGLRRRSSSGGPARERQLLLHPEGRRLDYKGDGGNLWNLEKTVEQLGVKVQQLEEKPCSACDNSSAGKKGAPPGGMEAKMKAELMWLKRGLEEHLRTFKNVFSNADVLEASNATLDLYKLLQLLKSKDQKKEKKKEEAEVKRGGGGGGGGRGSYRNRRDTSGLSHISSKPSDVSLLFLSGSPPSVQDGGVILFGPSMNGSLVYSDGGAFTAPVDGIYLFVLTLDLSPGPAHVGLRRRAGLFVLTLDLSPGPAHVGLRRRAGGAFISLHWEEVMEAGPITRLGLLHLREGEELQLELREGVWAESQDGVLAVLLLHPAT
ncbi:hypothetical protein LDENG_00134530 [Lucifuga dentata]|nr:hypothetical protein LDENG_00134530 [Lucifuga dentata]